MRLSALSAVAAAVTLLATPASAILGFNYSACAPAGQEDPSLAIGSTAYVCLSFNGATTSVWQIKVDQFTALQVIGSNYALPAGSGLLQQGFGWVPNATQETVNCSTLSGYGQTYYWVFDMQAFSVFSPYPRLYKTVQWNPCVPNAASFITTVPLYTVIIGLDRGKVSYIAWDDGCFFCTASGPDCVPTAVNVNGTDTTVVSDSSLTGCRQSLDSAYSPPQDNCYPAATIPSNATSGNATVSTNVTTPCDLKVFVTWTGTDSNGKFLTSAGQRFSRYRSFGVANLYQDALNVGDQALNIANSALNIAQGIPGRITGDSGSDSRRRRLASVAGGAGGDGGEAAVPPTVR